MHLLARELAAAGADVESHLWTKANGRQRLRRLIAGADWAFTQLRVAPAVVEEARRLGVRTAVFVRSLAEHVCRRVKNGLHICSETGVRAEPLTCSLKCFRKPTVARGVSIQRRMFQDADVVFTSSEYTSAVVRRVYGRTDVRVAYPPIAKPRSPDADHHYLTISRPSPGKGRAVFEALVERMPDREFLAVGGPPLKPAPNLEQRPECADMTEVYRATRILLAPSVNCEAFGRVVAEAASFGVPSVVSCQGGLPEAVGPGGIAVDDFEDPDAWVEAIEEIERNYEECARKALEHSQKFRPSAEGILESLGEQAVVSPAPAEEVRRRTRLRSRLSGRAGRRLLVVGPFVGELGWEIGNWIPHVAWRARAGGFDAVHAITLKGRAGLYEWADVVDEITLDNIEWQNSNLMEPDTPASVMKDWAAAVAVAAKGVECAREMWGHVEHVYPAVDQRRTDFGNARVAVRLRPNDGLKAQWVGRFGMRPAIVLPTRWLPRGENKNTRPAEHCQLAEAIMERGWTPVTVGVGNNGFETPGINLINATTLADLIAIYGAAAAVVGPSTGAMHLAAAVGTPHVVWGGAPYNWVRERYERTWNLAQTPVWLLGESWDLPLETKLMALDEATEHMPCEVTS